MLVRLTTGHQQRKGKDTPHPTQSFYIIFNYQLSISLVHLPLSKPTLIKRQTEVDAESILSNQVFG